MSRQNYIFTSESVSEGHPDKVCDRISDAILDAFLSEEPEARVACETFATTNRVVIGGEVGLSDQTRLQTYMERIPDIARACIKDIGYEQDEFHHATCEITNLLHQQSAHIAQGVNASGDKDEGAGDQGIMFGYATNETDALMPAPIQFSHAILRRLAEVRKSGAEPLLRPDAKSQISVRYENGKPMGVTSIVLSTQHADASQSSADIRAIVEPYIREVLPDGWITDATEWWVNPTGTFVIGGPDGDAGLTGRKIIVDTYGGAARMVVVPFQAKTRPRWTVPPLTPRVISPRTWLPPAWPNAARFSFPMPSVCQSRCQSTPIRMARAMSMQPQSNWRSQR